ncbi:MAG: TraB/GumN family protein [Paracoccus sp. (in: a-proteobacteria)]
MRLKPILTSIVALALLAWPAAALECSGRNLFDSMSPERMAELRKATDAVPYHTGLFWQADKGDMRVTLIGTYHFDDPRHDATMAAFGPVIDDAAMLMVEAGPKEEAQLTQAMKTDPALIVDSSGPTLPERLTKDEWKTLSAALEQRNLPAVIASRLRPWYVAVMLGISPCMMRVIEERGEAGGLDDKLIARAQAAEVPIRALEPWNTLFTLFDGMTPRQEEDMIRAAMPAAEYGDDYGTTLADAYFRGESWLIWEFERFDAYDRSGLSRTEVDDQMRLAQEKLMDQRNARWIAPIEGAAAEAAGQGKGLVVGFGALHLPGENGVLRLLERDGWTIRPVRVKGVGDG